MKAEKLPLRTSFFVFLTLLAFVSFGLVALWVYLIFVGLEFVFCASFVRTK